jgi:hypothetical protein
MSKYKHPGAGGTARGAAGDDLATRRVSHEYSKLLLKGKPQFIIILTAGGGLEVSTITGSFILDTIPPTFGEFAEICRQALDRPPAAWV